MFRSSTTHPCFSLWPHQSIWYLATEMPNFVFWRQFCRITSECRITRQGTSRRRHSRVIRSMWRAGQQPTTSPEWPLSGSGSDRPLLAVPRPPVSTHPAWQGNCASQHLQSSTQSAHPKIGQRPHPADALGWHTPFTGSPSCPPAPAPYSRRAAGFCRQLTPTPRPRP